MADPETFAPDGDADDAYDAADELTAQHQDWDRLDELAEKMAAVDSKDAARSVYDQLAGG